MSKYLLFIGNNYYPEGGAMDLLGSFENADIAMGAFSTAINESGTLEGRTIPDSFGDAWGNILELETLKITHVFENSIWITADSYRFNYGAYKHFTPIGDIVKKYKNNERT